MGYGCEVGSTVVYVGRADKIVTYLDVEDYFEHRFHKEFRRVFRGDPMLVLGLSLRDKTWEKSESPFTYLLVDHLALLTGERNTLITNVTGGDHGAAARKYFAENFARLT